MSSENKSNPGTGDGGVLLPCPFCAEAKEIARYVGIAHCTVRCNTCMAEIDKRTEAAAIAAWNHRAAPSAPAEGPISSLLELTRLTAALEQARRERDEKQQIIEGWWKASYNWGLQEQTLRAEIGKLKRLAYYAGVCELAADIRTSLLTPKNGRRARPRPPKPRRRRRSHDL